MSLITDISFSQPAFWEDIWVEYLFAPWKVYLWVDRLMRDQWCINWRVYSFNHIPSLCFWLVIFYGFYHGINHHLVEYVLFFQPSQTNLRHSLVFQNPPVILCEDRCERTPSQNLTLGIDWKTRDLNNKSNQIRMECQQRTCLPGECLLRWKTSFGSRFYWEDHPS